jgi:hypothetical protein
MMNKTTTTGLLLVTITNNKIVISNNHHKRMSHFLPIIHHHKTMKSPILTIHQHRVMKQNDHIISPHPTIPLLPRGQFIPMLTTKTTISPATHIVTTQGKISMMGATCTM